MPVKTQEQLRSELDATIFKNPGGGIVPATVHSLLLDMIDSAGTGGGPNYVSGTGAAVGSGSGSASALALFRAAGTAVGSGSAAGITGTAPAFIADFTALTSLPTGISLSRATTGTYFDASGVLQTAAIDAPRFDHAWNGSAWVATGLLIEEQRTNLILHSGNLADADWIPGNCTPTANSGTSPDGTNNATLLDTTAGFSSMRQQPAVTAGAQYTASIWVKQAASSSAVSATLTIVSPAAWNTGGTVSVALTNSWQRISVTATIPAGSTTFNFLVGAIDNTGNTIANSVGHFLVFGAQFEAGPFATSYITTTTAAVTRSADIVQLTGAALEAMQAAAASVIIEADTTANAGTYQYLLGPGSGPGIGYNAGANLAFNGTVNLFATPDSTRGDIARLGLAFSGAGRSLSSNGNTTATDANLAFTSTPSALYFGNGSANLINGHYRSIAIYNTRLSDSDLQTKSVVGAAF